MNRQAIAILNFDQQIERRRGLAFKHGFTRAAPARFFIRKRYGTDPAEQIRERRVHQKIFEGLTVGCTDKRHAALSDRACRPGFHFGSDFIDDDDFGHVIFDRFDHHRVLQPWIGDLHAASQANAGMRNIGIARNFVRRIDDHHAFAIFGENARALTQHRGLADARPPK